MATRTFPILITGDAKSAITAFAQTQAAALKTQLTTTTALGKIGKASVTAFAGLAGAVGVGAVGLFKLGESFDEAYDKIRVGTGRTGAELEQLKGNFRNVVKDVPTDFGTASDAITDIHRRLGLWGKPLIDRTKQMLELSRITGTDLSVNIEKVTRLFGDWGIAMDDQGPAMDRIFRASQATGISVADLSQLMVQFGAPLRALGLDFDTAAAMFAKFHKEGVNIETALPGLKFALKDFAASGREPAEALRETITAIQEAKTPLDAMRIGFETFGRRAGPDLAMAIREGRLNFEDLIGVISGGHDTIMGAAEDTKDWRERWQELKNTIAVELEPVASRFFEWCSTKFVPFIRDSFIPAVRDLAGWIKDNVVPAFESMWAILRDDVIPVVQAVAGFIADELVPRLKDLKEALFGASDEADKAGPSLQGWVVAAGGVVVAMAAIGAALAPLVGVMKLVGGAFGFLGFLATNAFSIIMRTLPFAHIITVALLFKDQIISALGTAWSVVRDFFVEGGSFIKAKWDETWEHITATLSAWWQTASAWFAALPGNIQRFFSAAGTWLLAGGKAILRGLWDGVVAEFNFVVVPWFRFLPSSFKNFFIGAAQWVKEGGKNIIIGMWNGIREIWTDVVEWFKDLPGKILGILGINSPPKWAVSAGRFILEGITKGLGLGAGDVWAFMGGLVGKFSGALRGAWSSLSDFFVGGPSGIGGLAQPLAGLVQRMISMSAGQIGITSGLRSRAQQETLYAQYLARGKAPPIVARPGTSKHERGLAADLHGPYGLMHRLGKQLGLIFPVPGEPWHVELGGGGRRSLYREGGIVGSRGGIVHPGEAVLTHADQMGFMRLIRGRDGGTVIQVQAGAVVINMPAGATEDQARRLGGSAGKGFIDVLARRSVMTDARIG